MLSSSSPVTATTRSTRSMLNRRWAIWAITRFVLSPSVEATNASARSMPLASRASISSAVPSVNCPPRSSQLCAWPRSSSAIASASSSSTETSWPSSSMELAIADPTRPQPTIRTNILVPQYIRPRDQPAPAAAPLSGLGKHALAGALLARGRCGQDDLAGRLLDHVAGAPPRERAPPPPPPAEDRPAAQPAGLLGPKNDRLDPAAARLRDDRLARRTAAHHGRGNLHAGVLLLAGGRGEAAGGADDVVVELLSEHRHEDAAVLGTGRVLERLRRNREAARERLVLAAPVPDVERHAGSHPGRADHARALVQRDHAHPDRDREDRAEDRWERHPRTANRYRERHAEGARAV